MVADAADSNLLRGGKEYFTASFERMDYMVAEYSYVPVQTVSVDDNVLFNNGTRACRKHLIEHRDDSGVFTVRGERNTCTAVYRISFGGNIAISAGGTVEPISIALAVNGETLGNAVATVTPAAIGDFWSVNVSTFVETSFGCCVSVSVKNISATDIDVQNANIIIERVA